MTTIYTVHRGDQIIGRCDSRCHEATGNTCRCCCGGGHHGIGSAAAIEDRHNLTDEELTETCHNIYGQGQYRIGRMPQQGELFACPHQKP